MTTKIELIMLFLTFLREKASVKISNSKRFQNPRVLSDGILGSRYIVLIEDYQTKYLNTEVKHFLMVISKNKTSIFEFGKMKSNGHYYTYDKKMLENLLDKNSFQALLNNGLYKGEQAKQAQKYSPWFSIQRLSACLKTNITGYIVHHIDKNSINNTITNLVPLTDEAHKKIHACNETNTLTYWHHFKTKNRLTITSNLSAILNVLKYSNNYTLNEIKNSLAFKISKSTISNIRREFFLGEEFIKWLEINHRCGKEALFGKNIKYFDKIITFDKFYLLSIPIKSNTTEKRQLNNNVKKEVSKRNDLTPYSD